MRAGGWTGCPHSVGWLAACGGAGSGVVAGAWVPGAGVVGAGAV